jgi:hypothetical protein
VVSILFQTALSSLSEEKTEGGAHQALSPGNETMLGNQLSHIDKRSYNSLEGKLNKT